jgi:hypothetical protein
VVAAVVAVAPKSFIGVEILCRRGSLEVILALSHRRRVAIQALRASVTPVLPEVQQLQKVLEIQVHLVLPDHQEIHQLD